MSRDQAFDVEEVLSLPLMVHLASASPEGPRDSPLWFLWEDKAIWLIGNRSDSFVQRLETEPRCALGIVDFDAEAGILKHVGIRGHALVGPMDKERLHRLLARYLGPDRQPWNAWFYDQIAAPLDIMIAVTPETIVAKDVSYFRSGPDFVRRA